MYVCYKILQYIEYNLNKYNVLFIINHTCLINYAMLCV